MLKKILSTKKKARVAYLLWLFICVIFIWLDMTWRAQSWRGLSMIMPLFEKNAKLSWYDLCSLISIVGIIFSLRRYMHMKDNKSRNIWHIFLFLFLLSSYLWAKFYTPSLIAYFFARYNNVFAQLIFPFVLPQSWNGLVSIISLLKWIFIAIEIELAVYLQTFPSSKIK